MNKKVFVLPAALLIIIAVAACATAPGATALSGSTSTPVVVEATRIVPVTTTPAPTTASTATSIPPAATSTYPPTVILTAIPDPGATIAVQGPAASLTVQVGKWYHLNLSCTGCKAGEENNYVFLATMRGTVVIDGTAFVYNRQPQVGDELCDPRDHWPGSLPVGWPQFGVLEYPCGRELTGIPPVITPLPMVTYDPGATIAVQGPAASLTVQVGKRYVNQTKTLCTIRL